MAEEEVKDLADGGPRDLSPEERLEAVCGVVFGEDDFSLQGMIRKVRTDLVWERKRIDDLSELTHGNFATHDFLLISLLQRAFTLSELQRLVALNPRRGPRDSDAPHQADFLTAAIASYPARSWLPRFAFKTAEYALAMLLTFVVVAAVLGHG